MPAAGLAYRLRRGGEPAGAPILMLHGLGGDEDVMWAFEDALPSGSIVVAARGLCVAPEGGYSWTRRTRDGFPSRAEFEPAALALRDLLFRLGNELGVGPSQWVWIGFSQGAGVAFAAAAHAAEPPAGVASLAGFVPEGLGSGQLAKLKPVPIYWGHGLRDREVPIDRARRDMQRLREAGAEVTACESGVGHKLGVECLRGLSAWLARRWPPRRLAGET